MARKRFHIDGKMKVGDLVRLKNSAVSAPSCYMKQGIILRLGFHDWGTAFPTGKANKVASAKVLWNHAEAGTRWAKLVWLAAVDV